MIFDPFIKQSFLMVILFSGVPLLVSSLTGLFVAILQASTQIQEQTITYVVKFVTVSIVFVLGGKWMAAESVQFVQEMLKSIAFLGRL